MTSISFSDSGYSIGWTLGTVARIGWTVQPFCFNWEEAGI